MGILFVVAKPNEACLYKMTIPMDLAWNGFPTCKLQRVIRRQIFLMHCAPLPLSHPYVVQYWSFLSYMIQCSFLPFINVVMVWHHFSSLIRFCADFDVLTVGWEKSKLILKNQYLKIVLFNTSKLFLTHSSCHSSFHIYGYFYWAGCRVKSWITCLKHTRERRVAFCFHMNSIGWLTPIYIFTGFTL